MKPLPFARGSGRARCPQSCGPDLAGSFKKTGCDDQIRNFTPAASCNFQYKTARNGLQALFLTPATSEGNRNTMKPPKELLAVESCRMRHP